jgi:hypothetical protein
VKREGVIGLLGRAPYPLAFGALKPFSLTALLEMSIHLFWVMVRMSAGVTIQTRPGTLWHTLWRRPNLCSHGPLGPCSTFG